VEGQGEGLADMIDEGDGEIVGTIVNNSARM